MENVSIMFCFNNNYVVPAAACFNSILNNCNKGKSYDFYVLQSDISDDNKQKLAKEIEKFSNCKIIFIDMKNKFEDIFSKLEYKNHFSKEVIYKLICPSIFKDLKKIIVTDVDVVFEGDISEIDEEINAESEFYIAGIPPLKRKTNNIYDNKDYQKFSEEELMKLNDGIGGGFLVLNLELMRRDNIEEKLLSFLKNNAHKLVQLEQDVINIVCHQKIKKLPFRYMVCSYEYANFRKKDGYDIVTNYSKKDIDYALNNPVQLHYATTIKPWKYVDSDKSEIWFKYISQTDFMNSYLKQLPKNIKTVNNFLTSIMHTKLYAVLLYVYHFFKKVMKVLHIKK